MSHCWDTHTIPGHGIPLEIAGLLQFKHETGNPYKSRADILVSFPDAVISHVLSRGPGIAPGR